MTRATTLCFVLLAASSLRAIAQQAPPTPQLVGGIAAVVGDSVILDTQVNEQIDLLEQTCIARKGQGQACPLEIKRSDPSSMAAIRKQVMDQMISDLVLVQTAQRDTMIRIEEATINAQVEKEIEGRKERVGGVAQFEQALQQQHMTLADFRNFLASGLRQRMMIQQVVAKISRERKPPPVSDKKLRDLFSERKAAGGVPARPATISFVQVVMAPRASDSALAVAKQTADSLLTAIRSGEDFITLAKRHSEDGSRESGGDLGWNRSGQFVDAFDKVVFALRVGEVSPVIETQHGFHIIKLDKVRGAERQARHILIKPAFAEQDAELNLQRGREVAEKLKAGANVDSMARAVGDPDGGAVRPGPIPDEQLSQPQFAQYKAAMGDAKAGDVVGPFLFGAPGSEQVVVLKVLEVREAGEESVDDAAFRQRFRDVVQQELLIQEIVNELRQQMYVEIRS